MRAETMKTLKEEDLIHFTGTEHYYRVSLGILITDGIKYVADHGGAYWLTDVIASAQLLRKVRVEEFQVWTLRVTGTKGTVTCDNGNGKVLYRQEIPYTDFPLPKITVYFENSVICLPSER